DYIAQGDYRQKGYHILGAPGEYMSYSNEGYAILSSVVDVVAGMPLEQFMMERVFRPLGMKRTMLDLDASEARKMADGNITSLFERDDDGALIWDDNYSVLPPFRGCACIYSTTNDMTLYYQMLAEKGKVNGKQVFPEAAVEELIGMRYPTTVRPYYCLGLRKRLIGSVPVSEHYGGLHGASTGGACIGDSYSISVFCNEGDVDVDPFMWVAYNLVAGLPWDTTHYRATPNGEKFENPEVITGHYVIMEGAPQYNDVYVKDGVIKATYYDSPVVLEYCGENMFAAYSDDEEHKFVNSMEFHIRDNSAWGVCCGERFFLRIEKED
ncbi:MAG: serine hydrolase, partial [Erysipelotrichaceae bacterium]|nr:serine hydrolase [Erysipelotrichaceae bacterium]